MEKDTFQNFEHWGSTEEIKKVQVQIADSDRLISEIRTKIEELKEDRQQTLADIELGLTDKSSVLEIERSIADAEARMIEMKHIKAEFTKSLSELERVQQKGEKLLLDEPISGNVS